MLIVAVAASAQSSINAELVKAAETGNVKRARELLEGGADPNLPRSYSALEAASAAALPAIVKLMLDHGGNVKQRDSAGRTSLNLLAQTAVGDSRENPAEVARLLIRAGADANAQDDVYANTALHDVANAATAQALIAGGADVDRRNKDWQTALMLTLDPEVTAVLLKAGADKTLRDKHGKTALDLARQLELTEKIALLSK